MKKDQSETKRNNLFYQNFELLEIISSGSCGKVYKSKFKNLKTKKFSACKFINSKNDGNGEKRENYNLKKGITEVLIHSKLKHKNIPDIYGFYTMKEVNCIAMEYEEFGDLQNFKVNIIKKKNFPETFISYLSHEILEAISFIHKNKIIHMDIKPQNVLIDKFLNVKLTDFSVSIKYKSSNKYIKLPRVGTSCYMSPEVLKQEKILVEEASKIDIYSFGVLLYSLYFCDYPYDLRNIKSKEYEIILKNIEENKLDFHKKISFSEMFKNFLKKCLEKDITKRYNIYEAMKDPWVKASSIILDQKEKINDAGKFLISMLTNNILEFNEYVNIK